MSHVSRPGTPLWRKLFLIELMIGLWVTLKHQFRPHLTQEYPRERPELRPRFRGVPRLRDHPDVEGPLCVACNMCADACPDHCITVTAEPRVTGKGKQVKLFLIDYERCCLCGLCVDPCPTKPLTAIYMSHDYELADFDRSRFKAGKVELHDGIEIKRYAK